MLLGDGAEKLESALSRPQQAAHCEQADLARQAVLIAEGVVDAHAFEDGNKRTAHVVLRAFLAENGCGVNASKARRVAWLAHLADGGSAEKVETEIRAHLVRLR